MFRSPVKFLAALSMFEEDANFLALERPREPLHVVLHEHLDRGALDRATALDCSMHATADRHVRAQQDFRLAIFDCRFAPMFPFRHNFDK